MSIQIAVKVTQYIQLSLSYIIEQIELSLAYRIGIVNLRILSDSGSVHYFLF